MTTKAAKVDIASIEYLLADLDPRDDETPEQAKARYLGQLKTFEPRPTAIVHSGNGLQVLWRLAEPIALADPVTVANGKKPKRELLPEAAALVADVEARVAAIMIRLDSKAGTQNIDRILRLPGTINLPNAKKRRIGRVPCRTRLIDFNDSAHPLDQFPLPAKSEPKRAEPKRTKPNRPTAERAEEDDLPPHDGRIEGDDLPPEDDDGHGNHDDLDDLIRNGCGDRYGGDRSKAVWHVVNEMLRRGYARRKIVSTLLDRANRISDHVYEQSQPNAYAERQVTRAENEISFVTDKHGVPYASQDNVRVALLKLGVAVRYDRFADRILVEGLKDFGPVLDDVAIDRIWLSMDRRFHLRPAKAVLFTVIRDTARLNSFHPVRDYLDSLTWDDIERIDTWLTEYAGAEDSEYSRAVGALLLVAAVRRVRQPGAKFDEMIVLESPVQGTEKSSALAVMATCDDWFTDSLPLNVDDKRTIEALRGRWIVEAAELSGMRRGDIEHIKALLSRRSDRARMSYDRMVTEVPRQCVFVGTTNSEEYLRDTSGNRRFWPVRVQGFQLAKLRCDRDQLWAEAAAREATGASIRLDPRLWPAATNEQAQRLTTDPFIDALQSKLGDMEGKIAANTVLEILDVRPGQRSQEMNRRAGEAMRGLGWKRPNKAGNVKICDKAMSGYVKGQQPWRTILAHRFNTDGVIEIDVYYEDSRNADKDNRNDDQYPFWPAGGSGG